jgi:ATP-dependent helicase/DNAse subunit B
MGPEFYCAVPSHAYIGGMGLTLVTGPANSGRAGEVLGAYRARLEEEPILVVPAFRDVEHTLRELAAGGAVFGTTVVRFAWLFETIAERCGAAPARRASAVQRELLVEEAVRGVELRELRDSAGRPGFARAAARLVSELERAMVEPAAFERALEQWAGHGPRRGYAREVASIYRSYRDRLGAAGLVDDDLFAWRAVDALRERPDGFGRTPVLVYGFDDFTPIELDALETLAGRVGVDVTVSLPYERGRPAFRAVAGLFERLRGLAGRHVELPAISDWYAPESGEALHHLERGLFQGGGARVHPGEAVRFLEAGGERAEIELVATEVLKLLRGGISPGDVAVVFRDPPRYASLVEQVFGAYGVPFSIDRYVPFGHTALGRGLLALLRCATRDGTAADLLAYLRTPGLLDLPRIADRLEADVRREGKTTAADARRLWERTRWKLPEVDRLRRASGAELVAELHDRLGELFARSYRRRADLFATEELEDPRALRAGQQALADLHALAIADPRLELGHDRVRERLERIQVQLGEGARPDRVQVAAPEAVRARRFEAVFVCGLQEAEFPRPESAEPFLSDDDRRAIAAASGLVLAPRGDRLDRERHLFYVCCSRAERTLALSSRFADEQGAPQVQSFLLEEVRDLFGEDLRTLRRSLSDVTWPLLEAPTEAEWERARALEEGGGEPDRPDGLHDPGVLAELAGRTTFSASALEAFADCPVKWLVDKLLSPVELEPEPEPLVRGSYAHAVLEATYRRLRERTGSAKVTPSSLGAAEEILLDTMREKQPEFRISPKETRFRTAVRRLEFDLLRHLRREADRGGVFEPAELELAFGMPHGDLPALDLGGGVSIRGKIDRLDTWNGYGAVTDYKSGRKGYPVARWEQDRRMQAALYMLAVRELLGLEPAAGVYVPLADRKGQPRGLLLDEVAGELGHGYAKPDRKSAAEVRDELESARDRVREIAGRIRSGDVRPCPDTCAWNGGCSYPSICREEG